MNSTTSIHTPLSSRWADAEQALSESEADLEALAAPYTDADVDRLADIRGEAIDAIMELPTTTVSQALRKIELAMFDGTSVRTGVDFPALLAEAKALTDALPSTHINRDTAARDPHMHWLIARQGLLINYDASFKNRVDGEPVFQQSAEVFSRAIMTTPAKTLDGLLAKALLVAEIHQDPDATDEANMVLAEAVALNIIEARS